MINRSRYEKRSVFFFICIWTKNGENQFLVACCSAVDIEKEIDLFQICAISENVSAIAYHGSLTSLMLTSHIWEKGGAIRVTHPEPSIIKNSIKYFLLYHQLQPHLRRSHLILYQRPKQSKGSVKRQPLYHLIRLSQPLRISSLMAMCSSWLIKFA